MPRGAEPGSESPRGLQSGSAPNGVEGTEVMPGPRILGIDVDAEGRCTHYHTELDVVANRCTVCGEFWACHECHVELADHPFGRVGEGVPAVMCGVCGLVMDHATYAVASRCPSCGHDFNPRCALHAHKYFQPN